MHNCGLHSCKKCGLPRHSSLLLFTDTTSTILVSQSSILVLRSYGLYHNNHTSYSKARVLFRLINRTGRCLAVPVAVLLPFKGVNRPGVHYNVSNTRLMRH